MKITVKECPYIDKKCGNHAQCVRCTEPGRLNPGRKETRMKAIQFKAVKEEVEGYIAKGMPIAAGHVFEQHELEFTTNQYYLLADMIWDAIYGGER